MIAHPPSYRTWLALLLAAGTLAGCQATPGGVAPRDPGTARSTRSPEAEQCALSSRPLDSDPAVRLFAGETIRFRSEFEATTFDNLPGERKRVIAGRQVLARQGVANSNCPVTQNPLPINAPVMEFKGVSLGFVSEDQSTQFRDLPEDVQLRMVARYLLKAEGIPNERCPISGSVLLPGAPTLTVDGERRIAFADQKSMDTFRTMAPGRRNEITARILLPERGVSNINCPMTGRPIRMDSPVVKVAGRWVALRNVEAARSFNELSPESQQSLAFAEEW